MTDEPKQENTETPKQDNTISILERAEKLNAETKAAEERILQHKKVIEEIETRRIMGGRSEGGSVTKTAEEIQMEEAKKISDSIVGAFRRK